jgi:hypothetical protein
MEPSRLVAGKPDGSTPVSPPDGSCHRLGGDNGLNLKNRTRPTLVGTGGTLQFANHRGSTFSSAFFLLNSTYKTIRAVPSTGTTQQPARLGPPPQINERMNGGVAGGRRPCRVVGMGSL